MSAGIRFGYRNLEHTPEATFVVKQRGFVLICSIEKMHIPQELRIRSRGTERHSASN
ncbi:MAG: hypothetical protein ACLRIL_08910 [Fusicatenibacter saccharivorans]